MPTGSIRNLQCNRVSKGKPGPSSPVQISPQTDLMGREERKNSKRRRFSESREIIKQTVDYCLAPFLFLLDELILEILSRLPVKSLLRFKCVSKSWKTLISDPYFVKLHLHRSSSNVEFAHHRLISYISHYQVLNFSFPSLLSQDSLSSSPQQHICPSFDEYQIVGACDGLLCLHNCILVGGFLMRRFRILNPATRLYSLSSPILFINSDFYGLVFGFGYDSVCDNYKVVVFYLKSQESNEYVVKVFSPRESCWREIEGLAGWRILPNPTATVNLGGTLNWVAVRGPNVWEKHTIDQTAIVSLDLGNETWKQFSMPSTTDDEATHGSPTLGVFRGCLCLCHDYQRTHFVVWQMKEFGVVTSWTQLIKVYLPLNRFQVLYYLNLFLLGTTENGEFIMGLVYHDFLVYLYKWKNNALQVYQLPRQIHVDARDFRVYVESLVIPH